MFMVVVYFLWSYFVFSYYVTLGEKIKAKASEKCNFNHNLLLEPTKLLVSTPRIASKRGAIEVNPLFYDNCSCVLAKVIVMVVKSGSEA